LQTTTESPSASQEESQKTPAEAVEQPKGTTSPLDSTQLPQAPVQKKP
jgi:hypothetical protein